MSSFEVCPICAGEVVTKHVEKLLRGGKDTAVIRVPALICLRCGERLYDESTVRRFEEIRRKLEHQDTAEFELLGQSFQVA